MQVFKKYGNKRRIFNNLIWSNAQEAMEYAVRTSFTVYEFMNDSVFAGYIYAYAQSDKHIPFQLISNNHMKKVILTTQVGEISIGEISNEYASGKVIAYQVNSQDAEGWCVLARIWTETVHNKMFGFIALNNSEGAPRYVAQTISECMRCAINSNRRVLVFENQKEFITHIYQEQYDEC